MSGPSMRDRLQFMQLLRETPADELLASVWQPKADEIDQNVQTVAKALVGRQVGIQRRVASAVAAEVSPQHNAAQERIAQLQKRVAVASHVNQQLRVVSEEEEKKFRETEQNVAQLVKDLGTLRKELQSVQGGSRYERLAVHTSKQLMGGRLEHWHPSAPRPPRKAK